MSVTTNGIIANVNGNVYSTVDPVTGGSVILDPKTGLPMSFGGGCSRSRLASAASAHKSGLRARPPVIFFGGDSNMMGEGAGDGTGNVGRITNAFKNSIPQKVNSVLPTLLGLPIRNTAVFGDGNAGQYPTSTVTEYDSRLTLGSGTQRDSTTTTIGCRFFTMSASSGYLQINFGSPIDTVEIYYPTETNLSASVGVYSSDNTLIGSYSCAAATSALVQTFTSAKFADGIVKLKNNSGTAVGYLAGAIAYNSNEKSIILAQGAWGGGKAANYADATTAYAGCGFIDVIKPDTSIWALTINDIIAGTATATYNTQLSYIAGKSARYGDLLLATGQPGNHANFLNSVWKDIEFEMYKVAAIYGAGTISMHKEFDSWAALNAAGLEYDAYHHNAAGYLRQASIFASYLSKLS